MEAAQTPSVRLLSLVSMLNLVAGCAAGNAASATTSDADSVVQPIPPERRAIVDRAQRIGRMIYLKDQLAADATDVMFRATQGKPDARTKGWIVPDGLPLRVVFAGEDNGEVVPVYEVTFNSGPSFRQYPAESRLSEDLALRFRARQLAMKSDFPRCSDRYNSVVLPGAEMNVDGFLVYLLAATTQPDLLIAGGHHLVRVSADATTVLETTSFTRSCLNIPLVQDGQSVLPMMTHITADTPVETHVFFSLVHKTPVMVGTELGIWQVADGKIKYGGRYDTE